MKSSKNSAVSIVSNKRFKIDLFHSLRTQLCVGAIALLGMTVLSISYFLIIHEKQILTNEIEKALFLQGRNIALSSEKALLRSDPEFELFPMVKTILENNESFESAVITDADGIIYGHEELQRVSKRFEMDYGAYTHKASPAAKNGEALYENARSYHLDVPVKSLDRTVGYVHLTYSKNDLKASIRRALTISIIGSLAALAVGTMLSLVLFRRISKPMERLIEGVNKLGEGNLETKINLTTKNEFRVLAESFNEMADRIAKAQKEIVIKERMEREIEIAREIQATLIPATLPEPEGYEVAIHYESATEVGGDYLDVIPIDSENISLVMADVSGKGVPGLVVMGMLKIMVHTLTAKRLSPTDLIKELNVSIKKALKPNMFVTFFVANLNSRSGEMVYSNAGHNPLVCFDKSTGRCELQKMDGPPMGILPPSMFDDHITEYRMKLHPGMLVLQYTDGLNESMDEQGGQFGYDRILSVCKAYAGSGAKQFIPNLIQSERRFRHGASQADDIALLALSVTEPVLAAGVSERNKRT
jgi:serine phosphatase RsbU (regulator of sigma subunit)